MGRALPRGALLHPPPAGQGWLEMIIALYLPPPGTTGLGAAPPPQGGHRGGFLVSEPCAKLNPEAFCALGQDTRRPEVRGGPLSHHLASTSPPGPLWPRCPPPACGLLQNGFRSALSLRCPPHQQCCGGGGAHVLPLAVGAEPGLRQSAMSKAGAPLPGQGIEMGGQGKQSRTPPAPRLCFCRGGRGQCYVSSFLRRFLTGRPGRGRRARELSTWRAGQQV